MDQPLCIGWPLVGRGKRKSGCLAYLDGEPKCRGWKMRKLEDAGRHAAKTVEGFPWCVECRRLAASRWDELKPWLDSQGVPCSRAFLEDMERLVSKNDKARHPQVGTLTLPDARLLSMVACSILHAACRRWHSPRRAGL